MSQIKPSMRAAYLEAYGSVDRFQIGELPVPTAGPGEVLIQLTHADVAVWDLEEREGRLAEMAEQIHGRPPTFPLVPGSDGAGTVAAVGEGADPAWVGEPVYAGCFLNPKGGFYAEYAVVPEVNVSRTPAQLDQASASVLAGDGATAMTGLADVLKLQAGESILILGAGGGIGHLALQLAQRMGARTLAVASGADGVALTQRLGADRSIDGRRDDILAAARDFAPDGIDTVLLTAGGPAADQSLQTLRPDGRAAYPNGIESVPDAPTGIRLDSYDGDDSAGLLQQMNLLIELDTDPAFHVEIARTFPLEDVVEAHRMLEQHYLGKLVMRINHQDRSGVV
ncbi:MAG: NADP-dependent oxidoreductase [Planctomycetota bacterium]